MDVHTEHYPLRENRLRATTTLFSCSKIQIITCCCGGREDRHGGGENVISQKCHENKTGGKEVKKNLYKAIKPGNDIAGKAYYVEKEVAKN